MGRRPASRWPSAIGLAALVGLLAACGGGPGVGSSVAPPTTTPGATLSLESSPVGPILATGTGHTLYDFALDRPGHSACTSSVCVVAWPPLIVHGPPTVAHGVRRSLVGTITRPGGTEQVTYAGHPLYTWSGDTSPGMVTGQALNNAGGLWYVLGPSGRQITTSFSVSG